MTNPKAWRGLKYPDSDLVGLVYRFVRPGRDVTESEPLAIDVGCGPGRHVRFLEEVGFRAYGIDSDPEMCATARQNGVDARPVDLPGHTPEGPVALALCWGLTMLVPDCLTRVGRWRPAWIIADWRSPENSCAQWSENERLPSGALRLRRTGHLLDGQEYFFYNLEACVVAGYERVYWQKVTRESAGERNTWFQTVHRRCD